MYYKCCVPGCTSSRKDAILHKFPICTKRLQKWLESIPDSLRNRKSEFAHLQICHKHFEARFVTSKKRLKITAYPSLFQESEIKSGIPLNSLESVNDEASFDQLGRKLHYDHTYCKTAVFEAPIEPINTDVQPTTSETKDDTLITVECQTDVQPTTSKTDDTLNIVKCLTETPKRIRKNKIVDSIHSLTPNCRKMYKEYRNSRKLLSFTKRAKKALHFSEANSFEKITQGMNPLARKIFSLQVNMCTKNPKARRFSLEEKLIALSILKQGPKCYRFLQKIFILPSVTTLKKLVSKLNVSTGINPLIFSAIKDEVNSWKESKKFCSIMFDEMALEPGLTYTQKDEISGFVDTIGKKKEFADHALVFLIKGVIYKWQQPIAYYLCEGSTSAVDIKKILKEIVIAVSETGLIPLVLISDQGASFRSALNSLREETRVAEIRENKEPSETIHINGYDLLVIFDPPHLIKGIRNNFLMKNIRHENKICSWSDIVDVYKTDCEHGQSRILHKLNDEHVIPEKIKKMKVKNCVRVFSKNMSAALSFASAFSHYSDGRPVSDTLKNTSDLVSFLDDIFDSVNGSAVYNKKRGKNLRVAVTEKSRHHIFWQEALIKLQNTKFINKNGQEHVVPTIKNWMSTIKSFMKLWLFLSEKNNIKIMRPRYMNSDAIENFFGKIRSYNYRDNNPTCHNFINTYKSLLITGFIKFHHASFNCEDDCSSQLLKIKSLFIGQGVEGIRDGSGETCVSYMDTYPVILEARRERIKIQSRAYTVGWVIRKILQKNRCRICKKDLTSEESAPFHKWITHREYKNMAQRKLIYPTEVIVKYFGYIIEETNKYLERCGHFKNIAINIKNLILSQCSFEYITCENHRTEVIDAFLSIIIKLCINNWCSIINKILKGLDNVRLHQRQLSEMQSKALLKYNKKLKKKKY